MRFLLCLMLSLWSLPVYAQGLQDLRDAVSKQGETTAKTLDQRQQYIKQMEAQHQSYVQGLTQGAKGAMEAVGGVAANAEQRIKSISNTGSANMRNRSSKATNGPRSRQGAASRPFSRNYRNTQSYSDRFGSEVEKYNDDVKRDLSRARSEYRTPQRQSYSDTYGRDAQQFNNRSTFRRPANASSGGKSLIE